MQSTRTFVLFLFAQAKRFPLRQAVELGELLGKSGHSVMGFISGMAHHLQALFKEMGDVEIILND